MSWTRRVDQPPASLHQMPGPILTADQNGEALFRHLAGLAIGVISIYLQSCKFMSAGLKKLIIWSALILTGKA